MRPRLEDAAVTLREALKPAARQGGVVVDVDQGAEGDRRLVPPGVDENESLSVLVSRRIQVLLVLRRELPIQEHYQGMAVGLGVCRQALGQERCRGPWIGPIFDSDRVAPVVSGGRRIDSRKPQLRPRNTEASEHDNV